MIVAHFLILGTGEVVTRNLSPSASALLGKHVHVRLSDDGPRYEVLGVTVELVDGCIERAHVVVSEMKQLVHPRLREAEAVQQSQRTPQGREQRP